MEAPGVLKLYNLKLYLLVKDYYILATTVHKYYRSCKPLSFIEEQVIFLIKIKLRKKEKV